MPEPRRIVPDLGVRARLNSTGGAIGAQLIVRRHTGVDSVQLATAATQQPLGVSMEQIEDGDSGDVQTEGKATVLAGETIAIGDLVTADATSRAAVAASTEFVLGTAETAGTVGQVVEVELSAQPAVAP